MYVDYGDINAQTKKDLFLILRIDKIKSILTGSSFYAFLDLLMRYHQVEVAAEDRY